MSEQLNRVRFTSDTVGTGSSIHFVAAYSNAYLTPSEAGVVDTRKYTYVITQGNDFEIQQDQVWTAAGSTIARGTPAFSKIGGTAGTTKITLDNTAVITFGASALDLMFANVHGADIASAATVDLQSATGGVVDVTGTTTITAVTLQDGATRLVRFTGALTLTNGASLVLPGAANIVTVAGDYATFRGYAAGVVRCTHYQRLSGKPVIGPAAADITDSGATGRAVLQSATIAAARVALAPVSLSKSANYTVAAADHGAWIKCTSTFTLSITAAATLGDGFRFTMSNEGTGVITIDPNASETIKALTTALTTLRIYPGERCDIVCDGVGFQALGLNNRVVLSQQTASASASIVFDSTVITSDFDYFEIDCHSVLPATDLTSFILTISDDSGSTYKASTYEWARQLMYSGATSISGANSASDTSIPLVDSIVDNNVGRPLSGKITFMAPNSAASRLLQFVGDIRGWSSHLGGNFAFRNLSVGSYPSALAGPVTNVKLAFSSGNIAAGAFVLAAYRK